MRKVLLSTVAALSVVGFAGVASAQNFEGFSFQANADGSPILDGNGDRIVENILEGEITFPDPDMVSPPAMDTCTLCDVTKKVDPNNFDVVNITGQMTAGGSVTIDSTAALSESDDGSLTIETNALASTQANSWSVDANKLDHLGTGGGSSGADSGAVNGAYEETLTAAINLVNEAGDAAYSKKGNFAADKASNYSNTNAGQEIPTFRNSMKALNLAQSSTAFGNVNVAQNLTETGKGNLSITTNALAGVQANSISVLDD